MLAEIMSLFSRVEGAEQAGLGQLLHARVELGVIRHGQTLELLLPALRGRGGKSCRPRSGRRRPTGRCPPDIRPRRPAKGEVHHALGLRPGDAPLQDLHVVLRRHTDGLLQNGGHPASGCGHGLGIEGAPLGVARVPDVHVGVDGTRDQVLPVRSSVRAPSGMHSGAAIAVIRPAWTPRGPLPRSDPPDRLSRSSKSSQAYQCSSLPSIRSDSGDTWPARRPASGHRPHRQTP